MNLRLSLSLVSLALLSTLSGCAAMLPIAGALVLKEAADRYEAANKPQDAKAPATETTVAAAPDDAAPQVEAEPVQSAPATRIASSKVANPQLPQPVRQAPTASTETALNENGAASEVIGVVASKSEDLHPEEYTDEEIEASRATWPTQRAPSVQPRPATKATLAPSKTGNTPGMPDTTAQGNQKAQAAIKTAQSIPTTEAAASESAIDSASRILATALKNIPNPQATPATKPAPITPQKSK